MPPTRDKVLDLFCAYRDDIRKVCLTSKNESDFETNLNNIIEKWEFIFARIIWTKKLFSLA